MERVFSRDIRNQHEDIKFRTGEKREWPKATWEQLASNLGMDLSEFTISSDEAAQIAADAVKSRKRVTAEPSLPSPEAIKAAMAKKSKAAATGIRRSK